MVRGSLQEKTGSNKIKIPVKERETVDTLLIKLSRRSPNLVETILDPRTGNLKEEFNIKLNGRSVKQIRGLHTQLKNRDEISICPQT